ncbi:ras-like protein family member 10B [Paramacrobiotus metropolitanus]|uniref:ras-like protein family member 10B n=1 Tax=Paramacrobiotus metropolitanus TaxID=2943436 RepID=UPI00244573D0|nr:ras-like protein family member 10B [Paramacrobiotus metropolitanus]
MCQCKTMLLCGVSQHWRGASPCRAGHTKPDSLAREAVIERVCVCPPVMDRILLRKTQIIGQFMDCEYREQYRPTAALHIHYKSVGLNERLYQLAILDLPAPVATPTTSRSSTNPPKLPPEWEAIVHAPPAPADALAYILVFDLTSDDSFAYIRRLREQLPELGGGGTATPPPTLIVMGNKYDVLHGQRGHLSKRYAEMVNVIRKQWKWHYVECSAKYNWNIQHAFKTLTKLMENRLYGNVRSTERLFPVLRRNRCTLC